MTDLYTVLRYYLYQMIIFCV